MLVIDFEKLVSNMVVPDLRSRQGLNDFFNVEPKSGFSQTVLVEVLEAGELKLANGAGLPDPTVEVMLGTHKERTKSKTNTLNPVWANEVQRIPIVNWALPNLLTLRVISRKNMIQRELGVCSLPVKFYQIGERHVQTVKLENVSTGWIEVAITVESSQGVEELPASIGSQRFALEVESPANLVQQVCVGSISANAGDWFTATDGTLEEPLAPSSVTSMESFGRSLSKKPSWNTWEKGEFLGSGTFGTVYEGVSSDGMFFAVKEVSLSDQGKTGKQAIRQLEQEIALLSEIEHPNIVQYLGTERDDEKLYIFLELVSKGSLAHVYKKYLVKYHQVRAYTKQILSGLKYLHDRKIIHRDIKCANILVDTSGVVKLADFGMAKQVDNLGRLKSFLGSAHWMAPEVINPKRSYNLMADIWSLGCTVLEMAIGKPPFGELEAQVVLFKVGNGEVPPIPDELEEDLKSFISNCLVVNAAERPTCDWLMTHPFITGAPMNGPVMHEILDDFDLKDGGIFTPTLFTPTLRDRVFSFGLERKKLNTS